MDHYGDETQTICCVAHDTHWGGGEEARCREVARHFPDDLNGNGLCESHMAHLERELDSESRVGWHEWRMRFAHDDTRILACDEEIGHFTDIPPGGRVGSGRTLRCGNPGIVLFIDESGRVHRRCPTHIPDVDDEAVQKALMPQTAYQVGRWETIFYAITHPLTDTRAFFLSEEPELEQLATTFLEFLSAVRDQQPADMPDDPLQPGWMGSQEDEARLEAAGEELHFPFIPESLREEFGGAATITEYFDRIHAPRSEGEEPTD